LSLVSSLLGDYHFYWVVYDSDLSRRNLVISFDGRSQSSASIMA
jgi:hypothetical protein